LDVGRKFRIKYHSNDRSSPEGQSFETEIVHITKDDKGKFKGHCLVGLSVLGGLGNSRGTVLSACQCLGAWGSGQSNCLKIPE